MIILKKTNPVSIRGSLKYHDAAQPIAITTNTNVNMRNHVRPIFLSCCVYSVGMRVVQKNSKTAMSFYHFRRRRRWTPSAITRIGQKIFISTEEIIPRFVRRNTIPVTIRSAPMKIIGKNINK